MPPGETVEPAGALTSLKATFERTFAAFDRMDAMLALMLALLIAAMSYLRIEATHAASVVNNCIFGADSITFWRWLEQGNYLGLGVHKHSLAVILVALLAHPLVLAGVPTVAAVTIALAAIWGAVAATTYTYFRRAGTTQMTAAAMTLLAFSTFGIATHGGIAETYGATLLMIAIACLILPAIAELATEHPWTSAILAGAIGGGLAAANAPSAAFILVYVFHLPWTAMRHGRRFAATIALAVPAAIILFAVTAPALVAEGGEGASWHVDYLGRYATLDNFSDARTLTDFFVSIFVFSFVSPLDFVQCRFVASDLWQLLSAPLRLAAYALMISFVGFGIVTSLYSKRRREVAALLLTVAAILLFYLYFNPDEALLYSPQHILALLFAAASSLERAWIWAGLAALLGFAVNLPTLHHERTYDPELCCPTKPASMLLRETPAALWQERLEKEAQR